MNGPPHSSTRSIGVALLSLCAITTLIAAIMAATGGFTVQVLGIRLSMHEVIRPVILALAFGLIGIAALGSVGAREEFDRFAAAVSQHGLLIAAVFAAAIALGTYTGGAHIAGGADSSGYLSEARLWRDAKFWDLRRLRRVTPLANELRLTNNQYPFTPVGYQPAGEPATIVPGYPPGLPLHFALAQSMAGDRAAFAVMPLCAAGIVMLAFLIGRRLGGPDAAVIAAAAAGASPILLYQATQPMSDVVAAFWWTLSIYLLMRGTATSSVTAGSAAVIACAVRPNLFAMVPVVTLLAWWWSGWRRRALITLAGFAIPLVIAAALFALFQRSLYGNASTSGYGEISSLFSLDHVWPNLARYPRWAIFTQSALIVAAVAAPLAIRRGWITPTIDPRVAERTAWSGLLLFACLQGFYLLYIAFDDWVYFRFLLPALPWILVLESVTVAAICQRVPARMHGLAVIVVAVLMASWGVGRARELGAFRLQDSEQRYLDVANFVRGLPPNSVFMTLQHSGSLAYYDDAAVLRWDWIEAGEIDRAIVELIRKGRPLFAVLDDFEEKPFRDRFAGTRVLSMMGEPSFDAGGPPGIRTHVYPIIGDIEAAAAGSPVSSPPRLALQTPRTPAAPTRVRGSAPARR